ncbi:hypothetical protein BGZ81_000931, partial [Podila clonocystis]
SGLTTRAQPSNNRNLDQMIDFTQAPLYGGIAFFFPGTDLLLWCQEQRRWQLTKEHKRLPQYNEDIELKGQSRAWMQAGQTRALAQTDAQAFQDTPAKATPPPAYTDLAHSTHDTPDYPDQAPDYSPDFF